MPQNVADLYGELFSDNTYIAFQLGVQIPLLMIRFQDMKFDQETQEFWMRGKIVIIPYTYATIFYFKLKKLMLKVEESLKYRWMAEATLVRFFCIF